MPRRPPDEPSARDQRRSGPAKDYGTHFDFVEWVRADADRRGQAVTRALEDAFAGHIEQREVKVLVLSGVTVPELSAALKNYPLILKPLLAVCGVAARALERDLDIRNVDTYEPKVTRTQAAAIAGYLKCFLPDAVEIPAVVAVDRCEFIDKEIRKRKGQWERDILSALRRFSGREFRKRKFSAGKEQYELDAAHPKSGSILTGIDVKRIEARRDIHKRSDEIVNKARRFKTVYPNGKFGAVIYYPFPAEHGNVRDRLDSPEIDAVSFAGQSAETIETAVRLLLRKLDAAKDE